MDGRGFDPLRHGVLEGVWTGGAQAFHRAGNADGRCPIGTRTSPD